MATLLIDMRNLTALFSANRSVREYTEKFYLPAAKNYIKRAADNGREGLKIIEQQTAIKSKWDKITFGKIQIEKKQW